MPQWQRTRTRALVLNSVVKDRITANLRLVKEEPHSRVKSKAVRVNAWGADHQSRQSRYQDMTREKNLMTSHHRVGFGKSEYSCDLRFAKGNYCDAPTRKTRVFICDRWPNSSHMYVEHIHGLLLYEYASVCVYVQRVYYVGYWDFFSLSRVTSRLGLYFRIIP